MNIDIICIGDIKEKYLRDAIKEYKKRIGAYAKLDIIELKEERLPNNPSKKDIELAISAEGGAIINKLGPRSYKIALCIEGKQLDSLDFARKIEDITLDGYSDISFIIGGSDGLSPEVKALADYKLSFSKMTFPHQLMRLILVEQVYRGFKILKGEPYHK